MRSSASNNLFRTQAWAQAWLDTWSHDARRELIDLGGTKNPREMVYRTSQRLKKIIPVESIHLVGVSSHVLSTPRAEYNDIDAVINSQSIGLLSKEFKKLSWGQFYLPDIIANSSSVSGFKEYANQQGWGIHKIKEEPAYYVQAESVATYLKALGSNTRLAYFNRREKLLGYGEVNFRQFELSEISEFFNLLNRFHVYRWGNRCYSLESQQFLRNFLAYLEEENGSAVLESMSIDNEVVSVLFDVEFNGCRYNFQSGYVENKFPKIALGAIHMGYAIESAIKRGLIYDFMAGHGKNSNYKERIATHQDEIESLVVERGLVKFIRNIKSRLN